MNWIVLSFAVITPMSAAITMAFNRREQALGHLAVFRATLLNLYSAHAIWDWAKPNKKSTTGRAGATDVDWVKYSDEVLNLIVTIGLETSRMLTLPNYSRARHRVTQAGIRESTELQEYSAKLYRSILIHLAKLTDLCEYIKSHGLPPNEATRYQID